MCVAKHVTMKIFFVWCYEFAISTQCTKQVVVSMTSRFVAPDGCTMLVTQVTFLNMDISIMNNISKIGNKKNGDEPGIVLFAQLMVHSARIRQTLQLRLTKWRNWSESICLFRTEVIFRGSKNPRLVNTTHIFWCQIYFCCFSHHASC